MLACLAPTPSAIEKTIDKMHSCIESYIEKKGAVTNATMLAILRATEKEIIAAQGLEESRATHNKIRALLLDAE